MIFLLFVICYVRANISLERIISEAILPFGLDTNDINSICSSKRNFDIANTSDANEKLYKCYGCCKSIMNDENEQNFNSFSIVCLKDKSYNVDCRNYHYAHLHCFVSICIVYNLLDLPEYNPYANHLIGLAMLYLYGNQQAIDIFKNFMNIEAYYCISNILIEYIKNNIIVQNELNKIKNVKAILGCIHHYHYAKFVFIDKLKEHVSKLLIINKYIMRGFLNDFEIFQYIKFNNIIGPEFTKYCHIVSVHLLEILNDNDIIYLLKLLRKSLNISHSNRHFECVLRYIMYNKNESFKNTVCFWLILTIIKMETPQLHLKHQYILYLNSIKFTSDQILFIWYKCISVCNFIDDFDVYKWKIFNIIRLFYGINNCSDVVIKNIILYYRSIIGILKNYNLYDFCIDEVYNYPIYIKKVNYINFMNISEDVLEINSNLTINGEYVQIILNISNLDIIDVFCNIIIDDNYYYKYMKDFDKYNSEMTLTNLFIYGIRSSYIEYNLAKKLLKKINNNYNKINKAFIFIAYCKLCNIIDAKLRLKYNYELLNWYVYNSTNMYITRFDILDAIISDSEDEKFPMYFLRILELSYKQKLKYTCMRYFITNIKIPIFLKIIEYSECRNILIELIDNISYEYIFEILIKIFLINIRYNSPDCQKFIDIIYKKHSASRIFKYIAQIALANIAKIEVCVLCYCTYDFKIMAMNLKTKSMYYIRCIFNELTTNPKYKVSYYLANHIFCMLHQCGYFKQLIEDGYCVNLAKVFLEYNDLYYCIVDWVEIINDEQLKYLYKVY